MTKYKVLVVDDEKDARDTLVNFLEKYCTELQIIGTAENIDIAEQIILKKQPDLVFLDIEMPYGNAFDLLERLESITFQSIFVTAFSQYAIEALNMSAAHYLLKPIDIDELIDAVEKTKVLINTTSQIDQARILIDNLKNEKAQNKKVVLPQLDGFEVKVVNEILYCQADENYTEFYFEDGSKSLICKQIKHYDQILSPLGFCRIHRSTLVNLDYITKYIKGRGGQVKLKNGKVLDVAESRKKRLLEQFGI